MPQPSKTSLFAAAKSWDEPAVAATLAQAPELASASDPRGRTALHLACAVKPGSSTQLAEPHGLKTVATLLRSGADLEGAVPMEEDEGDFRATPLWYAVARGENMPLTAFLLKRGANASHPLWAAVWRDDEEMCRALLRAKPELDLRAHGETPIFYAARLRRIKTLELLIEAGANSSIPDFKGRDAVDIARARRLPEEFINRLERLRQSASGRRAEGLDAVAASGQARSLANVGLAQAHPPQENSCLTTSNSESATMQRAKRSSSRRSNRLA